MTVRAALVALLLVGCGSNGNSGNGPRALGDSCLISSQCESQRCSLAVVGPFGPPTCGTCIPFGVPEGGQCDDSMSCVFGDSCLGDASGQRTCVPAGNVGDACDGSGMTAPTCGPGLWCDTTQHCKGGPCPAYQETGTVAQSVDCLMDQICVRTEGGSLCETVECVQTGSGTRCTLPGTPGLQVQCP